MERARDSSRTLSDIGEREAVELLAGIARYEPDFDSALGYPDDARDLIPRGPKIMVSMDAYSIASLKLPWRDLSDVAWSAITGALSDIVSKGGVPYGVMISLGLSRDMRVRDLADLARGIAEAASHYNVKVLGGDTNSSNDPWIAVASLGFTACKRPPPRKGIVDGDVIMVSGVYGAMGYVAMKGLDSALKEEWVIKYTKRPAIRVEIAHAISNLYKYIHATMDVSDGLGYTLKYLAELNNVAIELEKPPLVFGEVEEACGGDEGCVMRYALNGGEEYGVVIAVKADHVERVARELELYGIPYSVIGRALAGRPSLYYKGAEVEVLGWDQFRGWSVS